MVFHPTLLVLAAALVGLAACTRGDPGAEEIESRLRRGAHWMARFPETELRFDAAIGLTGILEHVELPELVAEQRRALASANQDHDNPMRRFWDVTHRAPAAVTSGWRVPAAGEPRVNVNRVVSEALHCQENGWRAETQRYVSRGMLDDGGYHSTHALWALVIAHRAGCLTSGELERLAQPIQEELRAVQPEPFHPTRTLDVDLYAERLLMLLLSGSVEARLESWAQTLARMQNADGSWGLPTPEEPPYFQYHATMIAAWALAVSESVDISPAPRL